MAGWFPDLDTGLIQRLPETTAPPLKRAAASFSVPGTESLLHRPSRGPAPPAKAGGGLGHHATERGDRVVVW